MHNAPKHSVQIETAPTIVSKKGSIIEWLKNKDANSLDNSMKCELLNRVKPVKNTDTPKYITDQITTEKKKDL